LGSGGSLPHSAISLDGLVNRRSNRRFHTLSNSGNHAKYSSGEVDAGGEVRKGKLTEIGNARLFHKSHDKKLKLRPVEVREGKRRKIMTVSPEILTRKSFKMEMEKYTLFQG